MSYVLSRFWCVYMRRRADLLTETSIARTAISATVLASKIPYWQRNSKITLLIWHTNAFCEDNNTSLGYDWVLFGGLSTMVFWPFVPFKYKTNLLRIALFLSDLPSSTLVTEGIVRICSCINYGWCTNLLPVKKISNGQKSCQDVLKSFIVLQFPYRFF